MAHYAKLIRRGARVVASEGNLAGIQHVAFKNPDGTRGVVVTNAGDKTQVQFESEGQALEVLLEPNSITTLLW